jgi:diguanylate cyclase (GGDEF)-like protein
MRELEETLDSGEPPEGVGEKRYQALRKSELDAWRAIYGTIKDFKNLKRLWVSSLDDLLQQREALAEKLDNAKQHMLSLESDREKLRKELELAHKNAALAVARLPAPAKPVAKPARKLSSLPKRDAFLRQLEAEIERAKRAGQNASLSLALIDVDNLDSLVEKHSRKTGDAVLQCYVNNILSNFRTYDVIARYDNNQFAVLFPDTAEGGALRALEKAQKRASETHMNHDGKSMPLPSFSSALTVYSSGDDPSTLLSRAMVALEDARMKGRTLAIADTSLGQFH